MARSHSNGRYAANTTNSPNTSASTTLKHGNDPAALLARGYSARYLGAVLMNQQQHITTLTDEEMERDLRHITAYQEAATRYHQLTYASTNRLPMPTAEDGAVVSGEYHVGSATGTGAGNSHMSSYAVLPVRIDPEEEKRAAAQAKRIQRAEAVREELEQQYVALRAHYVVTTQELQQLQTDFQRTMEFLQSTVSSTVTTLGYHRARLEITRNVAAALKARTVILGGETSHGVTTDPNSNSNPNLNSNPNNTYAPASDNCPMLAAWLALEEECKKNFAQTKGNTNAKTKVKQAALPWACTTQPAMAPGIPILLSALSTDPCKSLATGVGKVFGSSNPQGMTWLESHLPDTVDEHGDDVLTSEANAVAELRTEVELLEQELIQEREANQTLLVTTASARTQHDEWVAMISLVRQETEAVLHRHNVLLESDEVRDAAAAQAEQLEAQATLAAVTASSDAAAKHGSVDTKGIGVSSKGPLGESVEEGDADDEGMEEEGEEGDDWEGSNHNQTAATATSGKRGATAVPGREDPDESPGGSRKRRKV